jgi:hypothetical protein
VKESILVAVAGAAILVHYRSDRVNGADETGQEGSEGTSRLLIVLAREHSASLLAALEPPLDPVRSDVRELPAAARERKIGFITPRKRIDSGSKPRPSRCLTRNARTGCH